MPFSPRALPAAARLLCERLNAPPRLVAHLCLVHDTAVDVVDGLREKFPGLRFDTDAVLFGAATHDLGKVLHPGELVSPGSLHELDGPGLLQRHGVSPELVRFAGTHGAWSTVSLPLEDLLVALADAVWKGRRIDALEAQIVSRITEGTGVEPWEVFDKLDGLLDTVAARGDQRLAWQTR